MLFRLLLEQAMLIARAAGQQPLKPVNKFVARAAGQQPLNQSTFPLNTRLACQQFIRYCCTGLLISRP